MFTAPTRVYRTPPEPLQPDREDTRNACAVMAAPRAASVGDAFDFAAKLQGSGLRGSVFWVGGLGPRVQVLGLRRKHLGDRANSTSGTIGRDANPQMYL